MSARRKFLKALIATGLLPALPARLSAAPETAAAALAGVEIRRHGSVYLVDGWILTARDLEALLDHAR